MTEELDLGIKFSPISKDAVLRSKQALPNSGSIFKFKEGKNILRVLPALEGKELPWVETYSHYHGNWANSDKALVFNCPKQMAGQRCPSCEQYSKLMATGNPIDYKNARNYSPVLRVYASIIDRKEPEVGVQVVAFGLSVLKGLQNLLIDEDIYGEDFTHPLEGADLIVTKETKGKEYPKYSVSIRAREYDRLADSADQMREWLQARPDLDSYAKVLPYDVIMQKAREIEEQSDANGPMPRVDRDTSFSRDSIEDVAGSTSGQVATTPF